MPVWSVIDAPASSSAIDEICASTTDSVNSLEPAMSSAPSSRPSLGLSCPPPPHPLSSRAVVVVSAAAALSVLLLDMMSLLGWVSTGSAACGSEALGPQEVFCDAGEVVDEQGEHRGECGSDDLDEHSVR